VSMMQKSEAGMEWYGWDPDHRCFDKRKWVLSTVTGRWQGLWMQDYWSGSTIWNSDKDTFIFQSHSTENEHVQISSRFLREAYWPTGHCFHTLNFSVLPFLFTHYLPLAIISYPHTNNYVKMWKWNNENPAKSNPIWA
jgi:hypothetical protein